MRRTWRQLQEKVARSRFRLGETYLYQSTLADAGRSVQGVYMHGSVFRPVETRHRDEFAESNAIESVERIQLNRVDGPFDVGSLLTNELTGTCYRIEAFDVLMATTEDEVALTIRLS